ncbi:MAG: glutathione S-transferase family protein [Solirubrobacteraceae bacterium]
MIRLYRAPYSTNVERVAIALAHKGLEVESVVIDYADRSPVEAVSGQGLVPVIVDDGEVVVDSTAILRHLDERYPDRPLFPADAARRAEADVFLEWFNEVWKDPPNTINVLLDAPDPDRERIAALGARITAWVEVFERLLSGRDHLLGDALSAADCAAYPFLKFAVGDLPADDDDRFHAILAEYQSVDGHPRLARWIERMQALPQV